MGVDIIHGHRKNNVYGASGIGKIVMNAKSVIQNDKGRSTAGMGENA